MARVSTLQVSLTALAGALALAGCTKAGDTANTAAAADNVAAIDNDAAAVPPEDLALPAGDDAIVEDAATAPPIQVVEVPAPAAPAADVAPLTDAIAAEQLIDTGSGITRVQQADGWAWMQDGGIIRTASADGHRVSYFRHGETAPYLVQQDGHAYAYANGRVSHEYDDHGRATAPDTQHQREARQFADQAQQRHDHAQQASKTAPHVDRGRDHDAGSSAADHMPPRQQPSGSNDHGSSDHGQSGNHNDDGGRGHQASPHPTPTPTPSPTPSAHDDDGHHASGHRDDRHDTRDNAPSNHH